MEFQTVKQEILEESARPRSPSKKSHAPPPPEVVIELSDSDDEDDGTPAKKRKVDGGALPPGFLDPLPPLPDSSLLLPPPPPRPSLSSGCKSFWKAGDYEGSPCDGGWDNNTGGMDHVRVHPKFLHSNATSHKWALGAFAELLDNSLDEVCYGATYVNIDMLINKKDGNRMLLVEDNGGGMDPDKMRQCMSLGYSAKSKLANTIGQYGNGFKTSTMRLGADVVVFSRCHGRNGKSVTQSIGLLSYTFLKSTKKEDIVVPILDYELREKEWHKIVRSSDSDWNRNVDTMINWSPYSTEAELLQQFNLMKGHGTRIIIYNLWEDDQGQLELEFDSDRHDIQLRGVNRDERNIQMAKEYPNSRHFLTYKHSLRSYVSILYLRLPPNFRIILRGKDVEHHNVVNDMMMAEEVTYRPQPSADGVPKDLNMVAVVTIGFVKDATAHIDVQGFNVYHKNRLIKPFWRVWNAAGSDGRGVIGVLEANFVEPAHDKQGFERTTVLARLENKLVSMQKTYWSTRCHKIGYAPRRNKKQIESGDRESSPEYTPSSTTRTKQKVNTMGNDKSYSPASYMQGGSTVGKRSSVNAKYGNGHGHAYNARSREASEEPASSSEDPSYENEQVRMRRRQVKEKNHITPVKDQVVKEKSQTTPVKNQAVTAHLVHKANGGTLQESNVDSGVVSYIPDTQVLDQLKDENRQLKERLEKQEMELSSNLQSELQLERDKRISLETKLQEARDRIEELNKEQESLIDIFSEERDRRDMEEETLRKRLRDASNLIEELRDRVRLLESKKSAGGKR
ncbi:protein MICRORCHIDIA 7-like [Silene latifolia]|uniref:protein MICRORCHIDIA 7-like n=1 Tax=Silene latifolia TaxID=37657 RepID=UPI003D76C4C1